jgi:diguanylate cyclase (GGDEF)-like protein/PAS domain S-box-containing protein
VEKVLIIDDEQGACWQHAAKWDLANTSLVRNDQWQELQPLLVNLNPDLIICNIDSPSFALENMIELSLRNGNLEDKPVLIVGKEQTWQAGVLTKGSANIELCMATDGYDYLHYRINYLLELQRFTVNQSRALAELKHRNQALLECASEGIVHYDGTGKILYANPKALKILQYTKTELNLINVFDLLDSEEESIEEAEHGITELTASMLRHKPFTCSRVLLKTSLDSSVVTEINCNSIKDGEGIPSGHLMMFQDITARTLNEQRLIKLAKYDVLTGLSNRAKFHDFTEGKIAYCAHNAKKLALLFIDIDHFKNINDSMGHDAGDDLLVAVADRLRMCVRETDLVARIGGDEFAITLLEMGSPSQVTRIVQNVLTVLAKPFFIESQEINISASIGISLYPESGADIKTLTKTADTAMHQAKADGRNTYRFFSEEIQNRVMEQHSLEIALKRAIANNEFFMHYQPLIDAVSGRIVGLEALVRWEHEDWPNIGPHRFIPIAEESGLLPALGKLVLMAACEQSVKWLYDDTISFNYPVSVNLSPKQLVHNDFVELLIWVLKETKIPPENLVLELTETAVMQNPEVAISTLNKINDEGVKIAVDDFGTGYSSLNYLKQLPISKLKIDRSFVKDIGVDQNGEAIVKAILALAHSLNLEVVAEGVEEQSQANFLRGHDCDILQGYYFGKPVSVDEISELLRQEKVKWSTPAHTLKSDTSTKNSKTDRPLH